VFKVPLKSRVQVLCIGLAKSHLLSDVNLQLREAESDADANVCRAVGTKMKFSSALFFVSSVSAKNVLLGSRA
jgi:hypothetical protein